MRKAATGPAREAAEAARAAQIVIQQPVSVPELREAADLLARIWYAPGVPPMPHDLMRSLVHAGGAVHTAHRGGQLTGASVAVFGPPGSAASYSLITGVDPAAEGRGVGLALKLAQRAWALDAGAVSMAWTYDPLLRRNARFNLSRLGASVTEYLVDFYGRIGDGVNDPETDRLVVRWDLRAALPGEAAAAPVPAVPALLTPGTDGVPVTRAPPGGGPRARCWIPDAILTTRRHDPALARHWRLALRDTLTGAMAAGWRVTGFADPGWYLLAWAETDR